MLQRFQEVLKNNFLVSIYVVNTILFVYQQLYNSGKSIIDDPVGEEWRRNTPSGFIKTIGELIQMLHEALRNL